MFLFAAATILIRGDIDTCMLHPDGTDALTAQAHAFLAHTCGLFLIGLSGKRTYLIISTIGVVATFKAVIAPCIISPAGEIQRAVVMGYRILLIVATVLVTPTFFDPILLYIQDPLAILAIGCDFV